MKLMEKNEKKVIQNIINIFIIFCIIGLVLVPDISYHVLRHYNSRVDKIIQDIYYKFKPFHITYHSAFDNLKSSIGMIMTIVSLLLSTYINLVQRLEKNSFGITYREMQYVEIGFKKHMLTLTRVFSYITPFALIFVLNFKLCVTGYMLYLFCWISVFLQFDQYVKSFKRDKIPEKVVKFILKSISDTENWGNESIQKLDILLSEMYNGINKAGNWYEIDMLFDAFLKETKEYDMRKQFLLLKHFCMHFCSNQTNSFISIQRIWTLYLLHFNQEIYSNKPNNNEYAYLLGMLYGTIPYIQENDICILIDILLNIRKQGISACKVIIKKNKDFNKPQLENKECPSHQEIKRYCAKLDLHKIKVRYAFMLVILEDRFKTENIISSEMAERILLLKKFGDEIFLEDNNNILQDTIKNAIEDITEQERINNIIYNLCADKKYNWHKCNINKFLDIL